MILRTVLFISLFSAHLFTSQAQDRNIKKTVLTKQLDNLYRSQFPDEDAPGGSVLVQKGDNTVFLANYGVADIQTGERITEHTLFNTGSISKTFVANGILLLHQQGKLSIDDPILKYFPDFDHPELVKDVTIKHLLSHTSGIPDIRKIKEEREFYLTAKDTQNFEPLKLVDSLHFQPGERFRYSNPVYNGLALIIDVVTGEPWQKFIRENIYLPSGMVNSKLQDGPEPQTGVAHGYYFKDGQYQEYDYREEPTFAASGNSGVWSSVTELAKYKKAIQNAVFLDKELLKESRSAWKPKNWNSKTEPFIGYSWYIGKDTFLYKPNPYDVSFVYHTGGNAGYRSYFIEIPEHDILIVALFNQPPTDLLKLIFRTIDILKTHNWLEDKP